MNNSSPCPNCGRPLPATAPQGLCPECLLQGAFPTGTEPSAPHKIRFIPPKPEELATRFPQLEILAFIGQGGMGAVYKARQKQLDRIVALKILPPEIALGENFAARFEREAKALAKLNHSGIVILYEFGQADGLYYFLMEYVDGVSLRQLLHTGRIAPAEALAIVPQICDALQFAHDRGIVHRDIKPENILLSKEGRVKIADFGLAKITGDRSAEFQFGANPSPTTDPSLTDANKIMGTPNYMAPEQTSSPADVDHRADIYALGVVFYQMLTGELPGKKLATPSTRVQIDVRLDEVVLRALQAEPARRYQTVTALKTELDAIKNPPADPPLAPWEKRVPGWWITLPIRPRAVLLLLLALIILGITADIFLGRITDSLNNAWKTEEPLPGSRSKHKAIKKPATKTILLTRVTNNFVGQSQDLQTLTVWSDTTLSPGESLSAYVKHDDGKLLDLGSSEFIHWQPDQPRTSSCLRWWFGGHFETDFGPTEADAAAAQIRTSITNQVMKLTSGQTIPLFVVTNSSGQTLRGYLGYQLTLPAKSTNDKIQAIIHFDHSNPYHSPMAGLQYNATVPAGYSLRATATRGYATTSINHGPRRQYTPDYNSSWMDVAGYSPFISRHPPSSVIPPPTRTPSPAPVPSDRYSAFSAPQRPPRTPPSYPPENIPRPPLPPPSSPQIQPIPGNSREELEQQLQSVQDSAPLTVTLGQPSLIFSITNAPDDIYQGFLELRGPTDH